MFLERRKKKPCVQLRNLHAKEWKTYIYIYILEMGMSSSTNQITGSRPLGSVVERITSSCYDKVVSSILTVGSVFFFALLLAS